MDVVDPRFATRLVRKVVRSVLVEDVLFVSDVLLVLLDALWPEAA